MNIQVYNKLKQYIDLVVKKLYGNIIQYIDDKFSQIETSAVTNNTIDILELFKIKFNTLYQYDNKGRLTTKECLGIDIYDPYQVVFLDPTTNKKQLPSEYVQIGEWENHECPTTEYDLISPHTISTYFSEWSVYSEEFFLKYMPIEDLTHIYYSFVGIKGMMSPFSWMPSYNSESINRDLYSILILDRYASIQMYLDNTDDYEHNCKGNFAELIRIKKKFPDKKIILSIGGWSMSDSWHYIITNECNMKKFTDNVVKFLEVFDFFDGIDIDYEFPMGEGLTEYLGEDNPNEMINYSMLVSMLLDRLTPLGKTVSMTLGVDYKHIYQLDPAILNKCDAVQLMTYDFYGTWSLSEFGFNSSLYAYPTLNQQFCVDWVVNYLINKGVNRNQLAIGIAAYGRGWQGLKPIEGKDKLTLEDILSGNVDTSEVIPFQYGTLDIPTSEEGFASLTAILDGIEANKDRDGFEYGEDKEYSKSGYFIDQDTGSFMTYDTKYTAEEKAKYVKANNLKGCFYWEAQTDKKFDIINGINIGLENPSK